MIHRTCYTAKIQDTNINYYCTIELNSTFIVFFLVCKIFLNII